MQVDVRAEHHWLANLVGEWSMEIEMDMGPDKPKEKTRGKEVVRQLGEIWVLCEGEGEMPDGCVGISQMALGFDPQKNMFVGTFLASMMSHLWIYENGMLDDAGKVLTLHSTGPSFSGDGMAQYQDIIEIVEDGYRTLKSKFLDEQNEV